MILSAFIRKVGLMRNAPHPLARLLILTVLFGLALAPAARAERADVVRAESFRLLNEGVAAVRRGDFKDAVEKLEKVASMALNSFRAHYYLGLALTGDRQTLRAVDSFLYAIDLDPNHLQARVELGNAFLHRGDTDEAVAQYYQALKLRAEYPPALDGIARVHEARGEFDPAIKFFNRAIDSNRGYADAYTHLGDLYLSLGQLDEAVRLLKEAVAIRPDFARGLNRLALAYSRLGLFNEAVSTIHEAIALEPREPEHRVTLARVDLQLGLEDSAEQVLQEALSLDPDNPRALMVLAEVDRRRGDYELSLAHLDTALEGGRFNSAMRIQLEDARAAIVAERTRFYTMMVRTLKGRALTEDFLALAAIHAERGLWEDAVGYQAAAGPEGVEYERYAYMLFRAGRFREALAAYEELAAGNPNADREVNLGVTLARLGNDPGAIEAYRRALELDAGNLPARLYLGNSLIRIGETDEGVRAYKDYLDGGGVGEAAERARRILRQLAPELLEQDEPPPPVPGTGTDEPTEAAS